MVKNVAVFLIGAVLLYFALGKKNDPNWTRYFNEDEGFEVEFPSVNMPQEEKTRFGKCFEGNVYSSSSRHGSYKINGVVAEVGILTVKSDVGGCNFTSEEAAKYLRMWTTADIGGKLIRKDVIENSGFPGTEFEVSGGFIGSVVSKRVLPINDYDFFALSFTYPKRADYSSLRTRFFDSFEIISSN